MLHLQKEKERSDGAQTYLDDENNDEKGSKKCNITILFCNQSTNPCITYKVVYHVFQFRTRGNFHDSREEIEKSKRN